MSLTALLACSMGSDPASATTCSGLSLEGPGDVCLEFFDIADTDATAVRVAYTAQDPHPSISVPGLVHDLPLVEFDGVGQRHEVWVTVPRPTGEIQLVMDHVETPLTPVNRQTVRWQIASGFEGGPSILQVARVRFGRTGAGDSAPNVFIDGLPNQEAGHNECVPVSVSSGLQMLDAKHPKLSLGEANTSIASAKEHTGWTTSGTSPDWHKPSGVHLQQHKVTTKVVDVDDAYQALGSDCAVYVAGETHQAAVAGMEKADGVWSLWVRHDVEQGKQGGLIVDAGTLKDGQIAGIWGLVGPLRYFVRQCAAP